MPAVSAPAKALVTGANGYIAVWVVRKLLEDGYTVVGTVRSASKGEHLKNLFAEYGDNFEVAVVPDITAAGAFDEVVKGVEIVQHTASPFHLHAKTAAELIDPAVHGTTGILNSIKKNGTSVHRVVITSSVAAVANPPITERTIADETSWNINSPKEVEEKGDNATPLGIYRASKTLAERAAWKFVDVNKPEWDLVTINPPLVFGPPIHEVPSLDQLNTSVLGFYNTLFNDLRNDAALASDGGAWVDVRDVAQAHVLAAKTPAAGGERFLVVGGHYYWQDIVDVANEIDPSLSVKGVPGATKGKQQLAEFDSAKSKRVLGITYYSLHDVVKDSLEYFKNFSS